MLLMHRILVRSLLTTYANNIFVCVKCYLSLPGSWEDGVAFSDQMWTSTQSLVKRDNWSSLIFQWIKKSSRSCYCFYHKSLPELSTLRLWTVLCLSISLYIFIFISLNILKREFTGLSVRLESLYSFIVRYFKIPIHSLQIKYYIILKWYSSI